jgi:hypothetical protein
VDVGIAVQDPLESRPDDLTSSDDEGPSRSHSPRYTSLSPGCRDFGSLDAKSGTESTAGLSCHPNDPKDLRVPCR